jgi:hemoglobin
MEKSLFDRLGGSEGITKIASDLPDVYKGKNMLATHKGMNIDGEEFLAVLDDALEALEKNNIGQREKEEVLFVLYSMKSEIVHV